MVCFFRSRSPYIPIKFLSGKCVSSQFNSGSLVLHASPKKVTHKDLVRESTKLSATADVDSDLLNALCDTEQGFMRVGAMQQILDAVGKARQFEN